MSDQEINAARDRAWHGATSLTAGDRMTASALMRNAELDVIRKLVSAKLDGGEVAYWQLVEQELKR